MESRAPLRDRSNGRRERSRMWLDSIKVAVGSGLLGALFLCGRWLEPLPSGAAYASIFFALRAISMLACLPGFVSFALYRNSAKPPAGAATTSRRESPD